MHRYTDKVKDEIARQSHGMGSAQYAEFLNALAREVNIMASYASGNAGKPTLRAALAPVSVENNADQA